MVRRSSCFGRRSAPGGPDLVADHNRPLGPTGAGHRRERDLRRRLQRRFQVRYLPHDRGGHASRARLSHLIRRRPWLGAVHPDGPGAEALGHPLGGRQTPWPGALRHRRVRHHGTTGEVLPGAWQRAGDRIQRDGGRHGCAPRQGGRLRRQGGSPPPPRRRARGDHVHAHRR